MYGNNKWQILQNAFIVSGFKYTPSQEAHSSRSFLQFKHDQLQEHLLWCRLFRKTFKARMQWKMEYARKRLSRRWSIENLLMSILSILRKKLKIKYGAYGYIVLSVIFQSSMILLMQFLASFM